MTSENLSFILSLPVNIFRKYREINNGVLCDTIYGIFRGRSDENKKILWEYLIAKDRWLLYQTYCGESWGDLGYHNYYGYEGYSIY